MERNAKRRKRPSRWQLDEPIATRVPLNPPTALPSGRGPRERARDADGRFQPDVPYRAEFAGEAFRLCLVFGGITTDLERWFGVTRSTLDRWRVAHPEFDEAVRAGGSQADSQVALSLFKRATGFNHPAFKIVIDPKTGKETKVEYIQQYPPDTTACIFWLKNRQRRLWRDRWELQHSGAVDHTHRRAEQKQLADLPPAELMQMYKAELGGDGQAGPPVVIEGAARRTDGDGDGDGDPSDGS